MKRTIKPFFALAVSFIIIFSLCAPAFASPARFYDEAGLLSQPEAEMLNADLDALSASAGVDVVIAVFNDMYDSGYTDIQSFADDYYDRSGFSADGIALVLSMADRDYQITTAGSCIDTINDNAIYYIEDNFLESLSSGNYYTAFSIFAAEVSDVLNGGNEAGLYDGSYFNDHYYGYYNNEYNYYDNPIEKDVNTGFNWVTHIIISLVIGIVVAFIVVSSMKSKLKSVISKNGAEGYAVSGTPDITDGKDIFLYSKVAAIPKPQEPKNNSSSGRSFSSGGSSIHVSGGGVSHGGHGGKF